MAWYEIERPTIIHLLLHYIWPLYPLVMLSVSFNFLVDLLRQSLSVSVSRDYSYYWFHSIYMYSTCYRYTAIAVYDHNDDER